MTDRLTKIILLFTGFAALCCSNPFPDEGDTDSSGGGEDTQTQEEKPVPEGCAATVEDSVPLKDAFEDHFLVGVALNNVTYRENDPDQDAVDLVSRHFNRISAENDLKWENIEPSEGAFNFSRADEFVAFGEARDMSVYGHVLVWHNQTPSWVFKDENGDPVDRDRLLERIRNHIEELADRYGGRIGYWDVVNEAFNDNGTLRETEWKEIVGEDYISEIFKIADELLPDSKLVYNDYSMFLPGKRDAVVEMVTALRDEGVRIDAIGMQGHYNMERPRVDELTEALAAYREADIEVIITELDLNVLPSENDVQGADLDDTESAEDALNPYTECVPVEDDEAIAARWAEIFKIFVEYSDIISGVTFWGVYDGQSWLNNWPVSGRTNYPLLFDRDFQPKTCYESVIAQADPDSAGADTDTE